jgi:hypothetical protein
MVDGKSGDTTCFLEFKSAEIQIPLNKLKSVEGFPFEFELGRLIV